MRLTGSLCTTTCQGRSTSCFSFVSSSITGLALTASTIWLGGAFYGFLSILHAITVIGALLYLPFGKFFRM